MQLLYAAGFNAWNQLTGYDKEEEKKDDDEEEEGEPDDVFAFRCVLEDERITDLSPFLSYTAVTTAAHGLIVAGLPQREVAAVFSTTAAAAAAVPAANWTAAATATRYGRERSVRPPVCDFVEAANGRVAIHDAAAGCIREYASLGALLAGREEAAFPSPGDDPESNPIVQMAAYDAGFVALSARGEVWTWGDERYAACLGREVSRESPATRPGLVTALQDLPTGHIVKIAAGGYVLAALTSGRDLYCWGGRPGDRGAATALGCAPVPEAVPIPVSVDGKDVVDVGLGESHAIALAADGAVYVTGSNENGQLGLGLGPAAQLDDGWAEVNTLRLREGQRVVSVAAGPRSSFVLVDDRGI